ncbi:4Fe-4S dicluster domain-containing protein [Acidaminobacter sp. JC074]|uniref:4Fe-4S binding protein n=1 Tax=Acidaminobacter sp. JC074 TaxID=2530199 RepID=UPI001F110D49|nr:4Fe-4S binding protein [Acidaminobacter sp. JC074]MCH4890169.1 4Fe-4S dicluster domain-containing protein [Acidaminobacter sp. JC074]
MKLVFDESKCLSCKLCEIACTFTHENVFATKHSRISVEKVYTGKGIEVHTGICSMCGLCVEKCPFGAIEIKDGHLSLEESKCRSCKICVKVCPEGAIKMEGKLPLICNLCGGDPACIKWCPHQALTIGV